MSFSTKCHIHFVQENCGIQARTIAEIIATKALLTINTNHSSENRLRTFRVFFATLLCCFVWAPWANRCHSSRAKNIPKRKYGPVCLSDGSHDFQAEADSLSISKFIPGGIEGVMSCHIPPMMLIAT